MAVEGPHLRRRGGRHHRDRGEARAGIARADRRDLLVGMVVVEDLALPQGGARRLRRGGELGRARRLRAGRPRGRRRPEEDRALHLRRRPQGDVLGRMGRPAAEVVPVPSRSKTGRPARSPLRQGVCARPARGDTQRRMGQDARAAGGHRDRDGRLRRALRRRRIRRAHRHAGEDHRHLDVRLRDRAGRRRDRQRPRHLRHRQRLDHAGLLRHRGGAVGGRGSAEVVGRRCLQGWRRAACATVGRSVDAGAR